MANILTHPTNGAIYFDDGTAGSSSVPALTGDAVSLNYDGSAGLNITSYNTTSTDRFSIDGDSGRLFSVNDSLTGTIFSVNDAAGLPIIEVESTSTTDTITMGTYASNALVVAGDRVGIGTASPGSSYKLDVTGDVNINGDIVLGGKLDFSGNITAATSDTDVFVVIDAGELKTRTGAQVLSDIGALSSETVTSLALTSGSLVYTNESGTANSISLAAYLDEDSRSIASGSLNSTSGIVTFTRDDSTTFTLDLGPLLDDTNLVTSVAGKSGVVTLVKGDVGLSNVTNESKATMFSSPSFTGDVDVAGSITTEGPDGGMVMRTWTGGGSYGMIGTANMSGGEYSLLTDGSNTWLSAATGGYVVVRGGNNDTSPNIKVTTTNIELIGIPNKTSEATALVYDGSNNIGYRELGSAAFSATSAFAAASHTQAFSTITSTPTTVAGYGITDAVATSALSSYLPLAGGTMSGAIAMGSNNITGGNTIYANLFSVGNEGKVVSTSTQGLQLQAVAGSKPITFYTNVGGNTERMRITHDGNVGIGTTSPTDILTINETADSNGIRINGYDDESSSYLKMFVDNNGRSRIAQNTDGSSGYLFLEAEDYLQLIAGSFIYTTGEFRIYDAGQLSLGNGADFKIKYDNSTDKLNIHSSTNNGITMDTSGNVGIGTASPAQRLHVSGGHILLDHNKQIRFKDSGATERTIIQLNSSNDLAIGGSYAGALTFMGGGSYTEQMRIHDNGNVGIGTNSPASKLEVNGQVRVVGAQMIGDSATSNVVTSGVQLHIKNTGEAKIRLEDSDSSNLAFDLLVDEGAGFSIKETVGGDSGDDTRLFIQETSGNVGIGTTSPATILDLDDGTLSDIRIRGNATTDVRFAGIAFYNTAGSDTVAAVNVDRDGANDAGALTFDTQPAGGGNTERMRITSSGKVLVNGAEDNSGKADFAVSGGTVIAFRNSQVQMGGTDMNWNSKIFDDGQAKWAAWDRNIEIFSTGSNTGSATARDIIFSPQTSGTAASTERMRIKGSGNVGIGTNNPSNTLDIAGGLEVNAEAYIRSTNNVGLRIQTTDQGTTGTDGLRVGLNATHAFVWQYENLPLAFATNGSQKATILANGNFGIGNAAPSYKLDVNGDFRVVNAATFSAATYFDQYLYHAGDTDTFIRFQPNDVNLTAAGQNMLRVDGNSTQKTVVVNEVGIDADFRVEASGVADAFFVRGSDARVGIGTTSPDAQLASEGSQTMGWSNLSNSLILAGTATNGIGLDSNEIAKKGGELYVGTIDSGDDLVFRAGGSATRLTIDGSNGNITIANNATVSGDLTVSGEVEFNALNSASASPFVVSDGGTLGTRTAAQVLSDIGGQASISAPNAPASASAAIVGETVEVTFAASTTSNIDSYLVYSSIDGSDYGLISIVPPDDFAASMSIIDNAFDETGTQAYRVYAMKYGILSSATTASVSYAVSSAEPTTMSVINLNNAYYVQWNPPSSNARFVTAYNVYKHEHATQSSLSRSSASLIYSGMNTNYMYQISGSNNNNFHQFWVETTIA